LRDFILCSSFKCVRKFKFCVSPLVKRYPDLQHYSSQKFITETN